MWVVGLSHSGAVANSHHDRQAEVALRALLRFCSPAAGCTCRTGAARLDGNPSSDARQSLCRGLPSIDRTPRHNRARLNWRLLAQYLIARSARGGSRFWSPPTSSSLAAEERLRSLPVILLASLAEAGARLPLSSSLARRRNACRLAPSSRTAARQPGSARRRNA